MEGSEGGRRKPATGKKGHVEKKDTDTKSRIEYTKKGEEKLKTQLGGKITKPKWVTYQTLEDLKMQIVLTAKKKMRQNLNLEPT